ncbi:MAG: hypothetical protein OHK0013_47560 [Sandaracinaceae bacterium]
MAEVELALEERVLQELVDVHVIATELDPPPAAVEPGVLLEHRSETSELGDHAITGVANPDLVTFPRVPCVAQRENRLLGGSASDLLLPLEGASVELAPAGWHVSLDDEPDLETNDPHRGIVPVGRAHRDELDAVLDASVWIGVWPPC